MKILALTQKVDQDDPVLGFFHTWLREMSKQFEKVTVICLEKGSFNLPGNVKVLSLGKEESRSKFEYVWRFYTYIWQERKDYDRVFVHMNQEYVLLAGDLWRLLGKKVYLWRNHSYSSMLTRLAVFLSNKVFYTSPHSFTARFEKAVQMPVGIDTAFFKPDPSVTRVPNSVLFLGRISPIKKVLEFIDWVKSTEYSATIAGPILPEDREYGELVKQRLQDKIKFIGPVSQKEALKLYQSHEIYVNMTPAGSFDKTIVEAAACGMKLEVENPEAKNLKPEEHSLNKLMEKLLKELTS